MIDLLLKSLAGLKTVYEYNGIDFESDLIKLYNKIRKMMAEEFIAFDSKDETPIEEGQRNQRQLKPKALMTKS